MMARFSKQFSPQTSQISVIFAFRLKTTTMFVGMILTLSIIKMKNVPSMEIHGYAIYK